MTEYVPERGDVVWMNFTPHAGHEQGGRRPGLVLTPATYNGRRGLLVTVPVTSRVRGSPFEVALPDGAGVQGVAITDHVRSVDWRARRAEFAGRVDEETLAEVLARVGALLGLA